MSIENLDKIFKPKSVVIIGASDVEGSVGYRLMKNMIESGYNETIYPVNIKKDKILGYKAYKSVKELPDKADLAIIATPATTVPNIVEQCGEMGITGIIIISAGFKEIGQEGKVLEDKLVEIKKKYNLKIIGPNCLGIIHPSIKLNATFAGEMPKPGNIAFISQSGAMGTATLEWAIHENIGFSNFVSVGSMIDVDFGELIDYFGEDSETKSILLYIEGVTNARQFMSAARHFARTKPIIVVKAGKFFESAKAAASHTGSLTGEDMIYDAAFKRAGMVRVERIEDLFNCSAILGSQPLPIGPNLAIITNAGGPGILATDALISKDGKLAQLSQETLEKLNNTLPQYWSRGNPIDILGDAQADRYEIALDVCLNDFGVNGILLIYTIQGVEDPAKVAKDIVKVIKSTKYLNKTVLTSFIGKEGVEKANKIFVENNIPTYTTPEEAIDAYMYMYQYKHNLELLYETPEELAVDDAPPRHQIMSIIRGAAKDDRNILTEVEAKNLLHYYRIPTVQTEIADTAVNAVSKASRIGYPVVLKVLSPQITHKTDASGVVLNITSDEEVKEAYETIVEKAREYNPDAEIHGVTVQPMIKGGYEVILGAKTDSLFGPVIIFGTGGIGVEIYKDFSIGLPPLNQTLARLLMEETKIYRLLKGFRNKLPANLKLLEAIIVQFSNLLIDFPMIKEVDMNPLLINEKNAFALDARIVIDKEKVFKKLDPHSHLVISPYPKKYETIWKLRDGRNVILRPIKPEDEPMWLEMFKNFSESSVRYRFFHLIRDTSHEVRVRYCNIDYDREIAIVAELTEEEPHKIMGVVRIILEPGKKSGEIAIIIADCWQGLGLGTKLLDYVLDICKEKKVETLHAFIMADNHQSIKLFKTMGFKIKPEDMSIIKATLDLTEEN